MTTSRRNDITQGNLWKSQLLFFVPILLGSMFQQLYTTVDAVVVGQFAGKEGLAAIDATGSLIRLFVNFFVGLSTGATILISQRNGADDTAGASRAAHTAIAFALLSGALLTVLGVTLAPQGVRLMNVPADIEALSVDYVRFYCMGMIPSMVYNMAAGILRAGGDSRRPLVYLMVGGAVNVALDLVFVAGLGMGVRGAAIATVIAQVVSVGLCLVALARGRQGYALRGRQVRLHRGVTGQILRVGLPIAIQSAMYPISNMIIQARINRLGTDIVAAWAVCGKLDFPIWLVMDALAITISTFAAQNYGAGRIDRVRASVRVCTVIAMAIVVPISLALYIWCEPLGRLFVQDAQTIALCGQLLRFYAPLFFTFIFGEVFSGAIRGTGETVAPMVITSLFTCLLRVVWVLVLIPAEATAVQIVAAYPLTWVATSLAFTVYYFIYRRRALAVALA